jgi:phosphate starvation-inducible PhoH-like protein
MKMMLTRLGEHSNMIITGDLEQSDLLTTNGLGDLVDRLNGRELEYIKHIHLTDVHRHPAITEVLKMYDTTN